MDHINLVPTTTGSCPDRLAQLPLDSEAFGTDFNIVDGSDQEDDNWVMEADEVSQLYLDAVDNGFEAPKGSVFEPCEMNLIPLPTAFPSGCEWRKRSSVRLAELRRSKPLRSKPSAHPSLTPALWLTVRSPQSAPKLVKLPFARRQGQPRGTSLTSAASKPLAMAARRTTRTGCMIKLASMTEVKMTMMTMTG